MLRKRLARGGMAEVFLAHQRGPEGFDRRVAVKRVLPHLAETASFVRMFHDEARLAARLTHPNIVHIYEFGRVDEHYFIAMEYVEGVHAGSLIKHGRKEKLPPAMVARIGADACAGLHYAHELRDESGRALRIVHRDISPPNLMITYDGMVKLVDFGIAKAVSQVEQTRPGVVKGKYAYMSPEQTTNKPLDGHSDVFSLGLVLWELVAGRVALSRKDPVDAMRAIRDGRIPRLESARPDVPAALAAAIGAALEVDPAERPSAMELGLMLEGYIKASPELGTSLEASQWIRTRFPRPNLTGEVPAMRDGGTTVGTAAASASTMAKVASSIAGDPAHDTASRTVTTPRTPRTQMSAITEAATTEVDVGGEDDGEMTALIAPPTSFIGEVTTTYGAARSGRTRRIAVAAGVTAIVGGILLAWVFGRGGDAPSRAAAPAPADAARAVPAIDAAATTSGPVAVALPDAGTDAAPARATLEIITDPPNAMVSAGDERPAQASPARFDELPPGDVDLQIDLDGYESIDRTVTLAAGERRTLEFPLRRIPPPEPTPPHVVHHATRHRAPGRLTARTTPYSVVYLGRRKLGVTPFAGVSLPAGRHLLTFKNPKRKTLKKSVVIRSGKTTKVDIRLP